MDCRRLAQGEIERLREEVLRGRSELRSHLNQINQDLADLDSQLRVLDEMLAVSRREATPPPVPGLTAHIRNVLAETQSPLTARQIRESCEAVGIRASSKKNLSIAVYTILKRMRPDVRTVKGNDGRLAYFPRPHLTAALDQRRR